jgi:outer membrane protein
MLKRSRIRTASALLLAGLLALCGAGACLAADDQQQLTLQEAVTRALSISSTLQVSAINLDNAEKAADDAGQAVSFIPSGSSTPEAQQRFYSLVSANASLEQAKRSCQSARDTVTLQVYQAYYTVLQDQMSLEQSRLTLAVDEIDYRAAVLKNQSGGASQLDVQQAEDTLSASRSALEKTQQTLADDYQKLATMVGLSTIARPELTDRPEYAPLVIASLDAEISRILTTSPSVLNAQSSVEQAKIKQQVWSSESGTGTAANNLAIAEQNARDAEESAAQQLRTAYYSLLQLEASYDDLQRKEKTAEQNLRIAQIKYDTGAASQIDLRTAESALAAARQNLLNSAISHELKVMQLQTPWA